MRKLNQPIDALKYDIRVLWTGLKEEHVSADAGIVEGYPLDPPDEGPWHLVDFGIETTKEVDRYWTLWIREKTKTRKPRKKAVAAPAQPVHPPKKRGRKPKAEKTLAEHLTSDLKGDASKDAEPNTN